MEMPGGVSGEVPFCSGIQFGDVDWKFGELSSSTTSDNLCGDGAGRSLNKFKKVGKKEWKGEKKTKFRTVNYSIFSAFNTPSHTKPHPPGLLGGGGADDKKVLNAKPSVRSRVGVLVNLRKTDGEKVVIHTLADGHKVAKEMESFDTASVTTSDVPSSHPAYDLNESLDSADGNSGDKLMQT